MFKDQLEDESLESRLERFLVDQQVDSFKDRNFVDKGFTLGEAEDLQDLSCSSEGSDPDQSTNTANRNNSHLEEDKQEENEEQIDEVEFVLHKSEDEFRPPTPKFGEEQKLNLARFKFIFKNKDEKLTYILSVEHALGLLKNLTISSQSENIEYLQKRYARRCKRKKTLIFTDIH